MIFPIITAPKINWNVLSGLFLIFQRTSEKRPFSNKYVYLLFWKSIIHQKFTVYKLYRVFLMPLFEFFKSFKFSIYFTRAMFQLFFFFLIFYSFCFLSLKLCLFIILFALKCFFLSPFCPFVSFWTLKSSSVFIDYCSNSLTFLRSVQIFAFFLAFSFCSLLWALSLKFKTKNVWISIPHSWFAM